MRAVILGAGRPARGQAPAALLGTGANDRVLDWQRRALGVCAHEIVFVAGYRATEIAERYPDLHLVLNPRWAQTGPVGSLMRALPPAGQGCFIAYADTLFRESLVRALDRPGDATTVAIDTRWRERYDRRSERDEAAAELVAASAGPDGWRFESAHGREGPPRPPTTTAELVGLARLSSQAVAWLAQRQDDAAAARWDWPRLLNELAAAGETVHLVDCQGDWAELNAAQDLARFVLGTKAETLERLRPMVRASHIGEVLSLTAGQWRDEPARCLQEVRQRFGPVPLAVRSSALGEDGFAHSSAGRHYSALDVDGRDPDRVSAAINRVLASYVDDDPRHQVLVQRMLQDVALAGVVMTRTLAHGAPYRVFNFEAGSGRSDAVTSGRGTALRTLWMHHGAVALPPSAPAALQPVLAAVRELEQLVGHDSLDIEFLVDGAKQVHVLQVRPIALGCTQWSGSDDQVAAALEAAADDFQARQTPAPDVLGRSSVFSCMSDWNPAEMIGSRPRRLALDLYDFLIMRDTWARQRAAHGYRRLQSQPLMAVFAGHAYVDVRASLNSFIPADLDDSFAARLVDHQIEQLRQQPAWHDKLEFEIAITCLAPDIETPLGALQAAGFSAEACQRLKASLARLTAAATARIDTELAVCRLLPARQQAAARSELPPLRRALWWLADAREHGCLPFAHLARAAFIATAWLRGARRCGALDPGEEADFLRSIPTVATAFRDDNARALTGELDAAAFLARYGHLRPGTYDIQVPSYAEDPQRYRLALPAAGRAGSGGAWVLDDFWTSIDPATGLDAALAREHGRWNAGSRERLAAALAAAGLTLEPRAIEVFMRKAIAGREWAKFLFSRSLSWALDAIAQAGAAGGLDREAMSHLPLAELQAAESGRLGPLAASRWRRRSSEEALSHELSLGIELPPLIAEPRQFQAFEQPETLPNFVGSGVASGPVVLIDGPQAHASSLQGAIALALHADPGYDWVLGQGIAGFVTAYGGANSHMAVRAAELGLPAAVGVGEAAFSRWAAAQRLRVDGARRLVTAEC